MNYSVNLNSGQTVEVVIGEAAQINVEQALNYIESGRVEITKYVNAWAKPEITNYTNEYAEPIVAEIVKQTTKPLIDDYLNTTTKPQIDEYVADNVKPYADSAQDSAAKAKISKDNAKTSETNAKASELAAASSAGVASAAAVTATEAKDYTAKVLTDENLKTVGQDLQSADSNIKKTAGSIDNVNTVSNDIENINAVAANKANIDKVATDKDNIDTVATNIVNVNTVAKNIDNVNLLAPHTEAMEALAPDIMDVVTVAGITEQTKNVSENMTAVVDVSNNKTNINNVSVNMPAVTDVSKNMADVKKAVQSANDAKLWAIGTKTEKPEGSSKYWAEQAKNAVQTPDASETVKGIVRLATSDEVTAGTNDSAAITPLKLKPKLDSKQDKSTAVNYNNISNCITEIPQDIKLKLNNGTLTLKAGSKVHVPNGFESDGTTKKFNVVTITSDMQISPLSYISSKHILCVIPNNTIQLLLLDIQQYSGSTAPSNQEFMFWYDTANNYVKYTINSGSTWQSGWCLPLAIVMVKNGTGVTSIEQVFNGFGYIGSTVFALPGVKGRIPNGRNADGSLKSIEFTSDAIKISTITDTKSFYVYISSSNFYASKLTEYDEDKNVNYGTLKLDIRGVCCCGSVVTDSNNKITSFTPKTAFHALDYNDKSTISGWSMPSSRYIDLTLGASGTSYTAPANGFFFVDKVTQKVGQYLTFNTANMEQKIFAVSAGDWISGYVPVKKGMTCTIFYTASGAVAYFRFIYAEGEN